MISASGRSPRRTLTGPAGVKTSTAFIRFWVSVPVLSVQMKVVEPRVSTASRLRTSALRAAIRCAPMARDSVTVGSRPSGTSATVTPMANRKASRQEMPTKQGKKKNSTPMPRAIAAVTRTIRRSSSASGVGGASTSPGQGCDFGEPGVPARARDHGLRLAVDQEGPAKNGVAGDLRDAPRFHP